MFRFLALAFCLALTASACGAPATSVIPDQSFVPSESAVDSPSPAESSAPSEVNPGSAPAGFAGLAFIRDLTQAQDAPVKQVLVVGTDGALRQITHYDAQTDLGGASFLAWSPDGKRLAVGVGFLGPRTELMDADGSNVLEVRAGWGLRWSPDGSRILMNDPVDGFVAPGFAPGIHVVDAATGDVTTLGSGWAPHWLDDATVLAYREVGAAEGIPGEQTVFRISADASGNEEVMVTDYTQAIPSPDGARMALVSEIGTCGDPCMRVSIREGDGVFTIDGAYSPVWSPDSTRVAMLRGSHPAQVSVFDVRSGTVFDTGHTALRVAWSPDGERLALEAQDQDLRSFIQVIDATTGAELGRTPGESPGWAPAIGQ